MNFETISEEVRQGTFLEGDLIFRRITAPWDVQQAGVQRAMPPKCEDPKCIICTNR